HRQRHRADQSRPDHRRLQGLHLTSRLRTVSLRASRRGGDQIRERGHEFGTVTGRARRIGWFDAAVARYAVRLNGVSVAALMRLDILDDQPKLKICTGYEFRGARYDHPMANISHYKHSTTLYEE